MDPQKEGLRDALEKAKSLGLSVEEGGGVVLNESLLFRRLSRELEEMGVVYMEIHEAAKSYPDIFERYAFKTVKGDLKQVDSGIFLYVPKGVKVSKPIFNCFVLGNRGIVQKVYNLTVIESNAEAIGASGCFTLVNEAVHSSLEEIHIGSNAKYTKVMLHNWLPLVGVSAFTSVSVGDGGKYHDVYINYSEAKSISFTTQIIQEGDSSSSRTEQIVAGRGSSSLKYSTEVHLLGKTSSSILLSRLLSRERSRIESRAKIVAKGERAKGHIECKGMILGGEGEIKTVPELSSLTEDAELTHEASIGKIRREEIEYLETKGFSEEEAVSLLIRGFLDTGFEGVPETIRKSIDPIIEKLSRAKG